MVGSSSGGDDRGEKGNVPIIIDGLLCMDCGTSWSDVDIAEVGWLSEIDGHSVMVGTIVLLPEMGVFKGMSVSGWIVLYSDEVFWAAGVKTWNL